MIIHIEKLNDENLNIYNNMSEKELLHIYEPREGIFIAESPKVILRALDSGYQAISILMLDPKISKEPLVDEVLNRCSDIPIYVANESTLVQITGFKLTRGMLCAMRRKPLLNPDELLENATRLAVLECVVNPTNLGAIVRSAAALSVDGLILTDDCVDPLYRRCIRVSMGNVFLIPWTIMKKDKIHDYLHFNGFKTVAMALNDRTVKINNKQLKAEEKLAIYLGNEGLGLDSSTIELADYVVKIPMSKDVDSLNVAAASAIAFWELCANK